MGFRHFTKLHTKILHNAITDKHFTKLHTKIMHSTVTSTLLSSTRKFTRIFLYNAIYKKKPIVNMLYTKISPTNHDAKYTAGTVPVRRSTCTELPGRGDG